MNNYPAWWNETITVYNRYENPKTHRITWYRHVVYGCFWKNVGKQLIAKENVVETSGIICRIRKDENFLPKYEWIKLADDGDVGEMYTLGNGDIIILGDISDEMNEYESGSKSTEILAKYKEICLVIETVTINVDGGRGNEHYHVKGS